MGPRHQMCTVLDHGISPDHQILDVHVLLSHLIVDFYTCGFWLAVKYFSSGIYFFNAEPLSKRTRVG